MTRLGKSVLVISQVGDPIISISFGKVISIEASDSKELVVVNEIYISRAFETPVTSVEIEGEIKALGEGVTVSVPSAIENPFLDIYKVISLGEESMRLFTYRPVKFNTDPSIIYVPD